MKTYFPSILIIFKIKFKFKFFFFFWEKQTHTHKGEGKGFQHKGTPQLLSKAMVTFKEQVILHTTRVCLFLKKNG